MRLVELPNEAGRPQFVNAEQVSEVYSASFGAYVYMAGGTDPVKTSLSIEATINRLKTGGF